MTRTDRATSSFVTSVTRDSEEIRELSIPDLPCKQNANDRRAISVQFNELVVSELGHKIYEELKRSGAVFKAESNRGKHYFEVRKAAEKFNISPYDLAKFYLTKQLVERIKIAGKPDDYLTKIIKSCKKIMMDGLRPNDDRFRTMLEYDDELFHYGYLSRMKKIEGILQEDIDLISKNVEEIVKDLDKLVDAKVLILRDKEGPRRLLDENLIKFIEQNASREELKFLEIKHSTLVEYATVKSNLEDYSKNYQQRQRALLENSIISKLDFQEGPDRQEIEKQQDEQRNQISVSRDLALGFQNLEEQRRDQYNEILTQEDELFNLLNIDHEVEKGNREFAVVKREYMDDLAKIKQDYLEERKKLLTDLNKLSQEVELYKLQEVEQKERNSIEKSESTMNAVLSGSEVKSRFTADLESLNNQESQDRKMIESENARLRGSIQLSSSYRVAGILGRVRSLAALESIETSARSSIEGGVKGKKSEQSTENEKQERKAIENLEVKERLFLAAKTGNVNDLEAVIKVLGNRADLNLKDSKGRTILQTASAVGQLDMVNFLLADAKKYGLDINNADNQGLTALHLASYAGHEEVVRALLVKGALIDKAINGSELTALHIAAANGYVEVINSLKQSGKKFDINKQDKDKNTALHLAARKGHLDVVKALIEMGAKVNMRNIIGSTPVHFAIYSLESSSVIELLLKAGADPNLGRFNDSTTPLQAAAMNGKVEALKALLKSTKIKVNNVNYHGNSALDLSLSFLNDTPGVALALLEDDRVEISREKNHLFIACSKTGFGEVVAKMLEKKDIAFDIFDVNGNTPLHLASQAGNNSAVLALLKKGAEPDRMTARSGELPRTALHIASINKHGDVVESLLEAGADINKVINGEPWHNALYLAVQYSYNDNAAVVKNLLNFARQKPININFDEPDKDGYTPLCLALERAEEEIVNEMLVFEQNGQRADIGKKNHEGCNALHLAVLSGNLNLVEKVLSSNANHPSIDIDDFTSGKERTALHLAAKEGKLDILKTLLEAGADIGKAHPRLGIDTIHYAILSGNVDLVAYLLDERELDVNQPIAGDNSTALHIACRSGDKEMVEFLLARPDILVNKQDDNGFAPLHSVIVSKEITPELSKNRLEVVKALMKKEGIDLNPVTKGNHLTPLHYAVRHGMTMIVALLCRCGADLSMSSTSGITPLGVAEELKQDFQQQSNKSQDKIVSIKVNGFEVKETDIGLIIKILGEKMKQSTPDTKVSGQEAKALSASEKEGKGV